ncbi:hypothetical protein ES708_21581 [subsurface metagenome]
MSMYFERSNIKEYPGAGVIIPGDLEAGDCNQWPSLQLLVQELNRGIGGIAPTTIIGGLAYTEATMDDLQLVCTLPP